MKHIIIGGNGFVGRYLAQDLLSQGQKVVICDIPQSNLPIYSNAEFIEVNVTQPWTFENIRIECQDIVYQLAARQYDRKIPRKNRKKYFNEVNYTGTANLLEYMKKYNCRNLIYFSSDMVYGIPQEIPLKIDHRRKPLGPYGQSKKKSEDLCQIYREEGFNITIFRPRLIIGPGRLGVLGKLFFLIHKNLPVPIIGNGRNCYQMISVFDCVSAIKCALAKGLPNQEYNLGSKEPPSTEKLIKKLIELTESKSLIIKTPGFLIKQILKLLDLLGLTLMYPEQFIIADRNYIVDISKTENELDWHPLYRDEDMLYQAFQEYQHNKT